MSAQDVLVLADIHRDALADLTLELLAGARGLAAETGGEVVALVLSAAVARFAPALSAADRIVLVDDARLSDYSPEPFLAALQEVVAAEQPRAVLIAASSIGWDLAPLLAARLGAPLVTGCKAVGVGESGLHITTSFCGGKMMAEVEVKASPAVLVVLPGSFRAGGEKGKAAVESRKLAAPLQAAVDSADQGARMMAALASMIDSNDPDEINRIIRDGIPDPVGSFYRFSLAASHLRRGKLPVSGVPKTADWKA